MTTALKVLIIVTSHAQLGDSGEKTGFWFEELAAPYYAFLDAGAEVSIASPLGGKAPVDPRSEADASASVQRFRADRAASDKLERTLRLAELKESYDAYFVAGGHGVMWDLATDPTLAQLLGRAADQGKVVAAVCHGPAALVNVKRANGEPLVKGRKVTGFSNAEERAVKLADKVPFLLETRLRELGGKYEQGAPWSSYVVRDGQLVTGQNPASSAATARAVLETVPRSKPTQSATPRL